MDSKNDKELVTGDRKWLGRILYEISSKLGSQPRDDTLVTLRRIEECLSLVEQLSFELLQIAMTLAVTSLGEHELLRHENQEIRFTVTLCLSEIIRVTTSRVPYNVGKMREVLQLIIGSFDG